MASTFNDLRELKKFLERHVCNKTYFKSPDDQYENEQWPFQLEHPKVYLMENPNMAAPSITIKPLSIEESKTDGMKRILINLLVVTWNPGIHSRELYRRTGAMEFETNDEPQTFDLSLDGWAENMNLVDLIASELLSRIHLSDEIEIDTEEPLQIVPLRSETNSIDLQNYFIQAMEFTLVRHMNRPNTDIDQWAVSGSLSEEEKRKGL